MKISKKVIFTLFFVIISTTSVNAWRYRDGSWSWINWSNWNDWCWNNAYCTSVHNSRTLCDWDNENDNWTSWEIKWRVLTTSGNAATSWTISCESWDSQVPTWTVSYSPAWRTNGDVTINVACSDKWGSRCNMVDISGWTKSGNNYYKVVSSNNSWSITLKDWAWNTDTLNYNADKIDKIAPTGTISYSTTDWTNNNVIVTVTCSDTWGSACENTTYRKTIKSNQSWNITIKDNAWNTTNIPYSVNNIDKIAPTWSLSYSTTDWTNEDISVTVTCSDTWGSRCENSSYSTTVASNWPWAITIRDNAWNTTNIEYNVTNIDKIKPVLSDISWAWVKQDWEYLLANTEQDFSIQVKNFSWLSSEKAPIVIIEWEFTKNDNTGTEWINDVFYNFWDTNTKLTIKKNISNIDIDKWPNNYRKFTFKLTKICDKAWNCMDNPPTYKYYVYAWEVYPSNSSISSNELTRGDLANWSEKELIVTLKDTYWNIIVPVKKADWTTAIRDVKLKINYDNSLYLNQYSLSWESWINFTKFNNDNFNQWLITWNDLTNTTEINDINNNWIYTTKFKVYSPTYKENVSDWRQYLTWNFNINDIKYNLTDWSTAYWTLSSSNIDFQFKPLYTIDITWDLKDSWFVEGTIQESKLDINKTWTVNSKAYVKFWWEDSSLDNLDLKYSKITNSNLVNPVSKTNWAITNTTYLWNVTTDVNQDIYTDLMMDTGAFLDDLENIYFSTHLTYTVWWKNVVINQDLIWKDNYHNSNYNSEIAQIWLKVTWTTFTEKWARFINSWESDNMNTINWDLNKSIILKDLKQNVYNNVKYFNYKEAQNVNTINNLEDINNNQNIWGHYILNNNNVIYYNKLDWKTVSIWNWANSAGIKISWKKTIIIEWWNLYINQNMYYWNKNSDILWIIVLKDKNWKWWNLYIEPEVTNIVWNIFVEKSIIAYNWINELDWYSDITNFKNQLHIYGSIASYNTLWWSKKDPLECPYYINDCSDQKVAQKYDINYLRRYFIRSWIPNQNWKVIWGWTCNSNWNCTLWNSNFVRNITNSSDPYYEDNIIIEYNPLIKIVQPPFFAK